MPNSDAMDTKLKLSAQPNESGARPECFELVKDAILFLNDPNGSSVRAITEHITANNWVPEGTEEWVRAALSEGVESGTLQRI